MASRRAAACCSRSLGGSARASLLSVVVLLVALLGCQSPHLTAETMPAALEVASANPTPYMNIAEMVAPGTGTNQISAGDLLEMTVTSGSRADEEEAKPFQVRVGDDGTVDAPPIGPVQVAGMEPPTAEQRISQAAIERGIFVRPSVTLQVLKPAVNRVTVLGAVMEPGVKELPKGSSDLARALAAAGGLAEEASTKVDVLRNSKPSFMADAASGNGVVQASYSPESAPRTERVDLAQAPGKQTPSYSLGDRDVVMVLPQEKQFIHVTGLVRLPNQFELTRHQDVTVMDAIALAGGVSSPVADKVFVIRRLPDMKEPAVIELSIREAKADGKENLRLAPGDLVSVERTVSTVVVDSAMSVFRVGLSVGGNLVAF
jgi:polysaccharide export outer membrane protein